MSQNTDSDSPKCVRVRRHFRFVEMRSDTAPVGWMISRVRPWIQQVCGRRSGLILSFKSEKDEEFSEWFEGWPVLERQDWQGEGWYIWAFEADACFQAEGLLKAYLETPRPSQFRFLEMQADRTMIGWMITHVLPSIRRTCSDTVIIRYKRTREECRNYHDWYGVGWYIWAANEKDCDEAIMQLTQYAAQWPTSFARAQPQLYDFVRKELVVQK